MVEEIFEIRSEEDLFRAIQIFDGGDHDDLPSVTFVDWPRYEITIRGEDFDGGVPTRIMPAFLKLQSTIRRGYARSVHGSGRHRLTKEELKQTELVVLLEAGASTKFLSELAPLFNNAIKNMSGTQTVIVILGLAAIVPSSFIWKAYVDAEVQKREIEHRTVATKEETERFHMVVNLADRYADVAEHLADTNATQNTLLKRLEDDDQLLVDGDEIIDGETARQIVRKIRQEPISDRLDSTFIILSVESGSVRDGFRVHIRDTVSGDKLKVSIPSGTLSEEQLDALRNGEWQKQPLRLEINTRRIGKRILEATLISAGLAVAN